MTSFKPHFSLDLPPSQGSETRDSLYLALELHCPTDACASARQMRGKRYLTDEAPLLPLADCDRPGRCSCQYRQRDDRRQERRRKGDAG